MKIPEHPLHFQNKDEWRAWLQVHHGGEKEVWLTIAKAGAAQPGVSYEEAVEEALCFGWIDGLMKGSETDVYWLRFSPRKRGSIWSASNRKRVARLVEQGRMTEAGMVEVRKAQENGEWEAALQREDTSNPPDDLRTALQANPLAQANFEKLAPSHKKQYLYWIDSAKTEPTRQKRIQQTVKMVADGKRMGEE